MPGAQTPSVASSGAHRQSSNQDVHYVEIPPSSPLREFTQRNRKPAFSSAAKGPGSSTSVKPARFPDREPLTPLRRSPYALLITVPYAFVAIFSWVVLCILTYRPITTTPYPYRQVERSKLWYYEKAAPFQNEIWYRAARVLQSVAGVLSIPVASAVCSCAALIFVQQSRSRLTMRQAMALADSAWADPRAYAKLLLGRLSWRQYGSSFLGLAIVVHLLGVVIFPLQHLLMFSENIKLPTRPVVIHDVLDLPNHWAGLYEPSEDIPDRSGVVLILRNALGVATSHHPQANLWQGERFNCTQVGNNFHASCQKFSPSFNNFTLLSDPFYAELPTGFNTGLLRQFIPRINSTAVYERISAEEFPKGCDKLPESLYAQYRNESESMPAYRWSLTVCMPGALETSPWKHTRDRQDFSEILYLEVSSGLIYHPPYEVVDGWFKVTVNTTAGYFELPNYFNGGLAGPLLDRDPFDDCAPKCDQFRYLVKRDHAQTSLRDAQPRIIHRADPLGKNNPDSSVFDPPFNKGPLLTTALALFGEGSFLDAFPQRYIAFKDSISAVKSKGHDWPDACIDLSPLSGLLRGEFGQIGSTADRYPCTKSVPDLGTFVGGGIRSLFLANTVRTSNIFTAAAFLANKVWVENYAVGSHTLKVSYDPGTDSIIPVISIRSMVAISIVLGTFVTALLALASYSYITPRWTLRLDAFTMFRFGTQVPYGVPFLVGKSAETVKVLDEIPAYVGDAVALEEEVGRIAFGEGAKLNRKRRYLCYEGDDKLTFDERREYNRRKLEADGSSIVRL